MQYEHYLKSMFEPQSVAIVGASERHDSIGAVLIRNMLDARYNGALHAINPKHDSVQGVPCVARLDDLRKRPDLAVICTPAATVPGLIEECGRAGIKSAVVISSGFAECGPAGAELERRTRIAAKRSGVRIIGPNCLGLMRPAIGLNATFARAAGIPGSIGLISQSGAICTALLDWAQTNGVGFSTVVSLGASIDLDFGEILDYMIADPRTESIFMYIEGIRDARRFMSAVRAAARVKPVLAIKVGRHPAGSKAVASHTGAMVGSDDVFDAALRRAGVVRLANVGQMYAAASALFSHFRPRGKRLAIITNGGGPGVMAADHAADIGIPLAQLDPANAAFYETRRADFALRWRAAMQGWETRAARLKGVRVVSQHNGFPYLYQWLGLVAVAISVTSLDPRLSGKLEPRAAAPAKRLAALGRLVDAGVPVHCSVAPVIPAITDEFMEEIVARAAALGVKSCGWIPIRLPHEVAPLFREWLSVHFPERGDKVMHIVQSIRGGRDNDPDFFTRMKPSGVWADLFRARFRLACKRAGLGKPKFDLDCTRFRPPEVGGQLRLL